MRDIREHVIGTVAAVVGTTVIAFGLVAFATPRPSRDLVPVQNGEWLLRGDRVIHINGPGGVKDAESGPLRWSNGMRFAPIVVGGNREVIVATSDQILRLPEPRYEVKRVDVVQSQAEAVEVPGPGVAMVGYPSAGKVARIPDVSSDTQFVTLSRPFTSLVRVSDGTAWVVLDTGEVCHIRPGTPTTRCAGSVSTTGATDGRLVLTGDRPLYVAPASRVAAWVDASGVGRVIELPEGVDATARVNAWNRDNEITAYVPRTRSLMVATVGETALENVRWAKVDSTRYEAPIPTSGAIALFDSTTGAVLTLDKKDLDRRARGAPVGKNAKGSLEPDGYGYIHGDGKTVNIVEPNGLIKAVDVGVVDRKPPAPPKADPKPGAKPPRKPSPPRKTEQSPRVPPNVVPSRAPGAPTAVDAVAGDASATVSWGDAPSNGAPVTRYVVTWRTPDGAPVRRDAGRGERSFDVGGLVNEVAYTFAVHAENSAGPGPAAVAPPVTPTAAVPAAPVDVVARAHADETATVSWAPGDGRPVTYTVTARSGQGASVVVARRTPGTSVRVGRAEGLSVGTPFRFSVVAVGDGGVAGPASVPSDPVTLAGPPDAPRDVLAEPFGDRRLRVRWSPPSDTHGGRVLRYEVRSDRGQSASVAAPATEVTFQNLTNGTSYTFTVRAVTGSDAGDLTGAAATAQAVPGGPPALAGFDATAAGDRTIRVSFTVDDNRSGAATCHIYLDAREQWAGPCAGASTVDLSGLAYSTTYDVWATATNGYGTSAPAGHVPVTTNGPPRAVTLSKGSSVSSASCNTPTCAWLRVRLQGFSPNTAYSVRCYSQDNPGGWQTYSVTTDGNGAADDASGCYYGFAGRQVWVVAGGVESNRVTW